MSGFDSRERVAV